MKGSAVVLKKGSVASGTTIAAMRTISFSLNAETVDITSADDTNRWRQLLAAAGVKSMSVSMSGVLKDVATHDQLIDDFVAQTSDNYALVASTLGSFHGAFQVTQFEGSGEYNAEAQFTVTLESAGDITYVAIA